MRDKVLVIAGVGLILAVVAWNVSLGIKAMDFVPKNTAAIVVNSDIADFSRKPCPDCGCSSIRVDEQLVRCQTCGCEFFSAD